MIVQVAVPCPLYSLFDYEVDAIDSPIGCRVSVPFGNQRLVGVVVATVERSQYDTLKKGALLDHHSIFTKDLLQLGQWIADYYHAPIGLVFRMMMPQRLRRSELYQRSTVPMIELSDDFALWLEENKNKRARVAIIENLIEVAPTFRQDFINKYANYKSHEKALVNDSVIRIVQTLPESIKYIDHTFPKLPYALNHEQCEAIEAVELQKFSVALLEGVTGSGKTAVYLELVKKVLQQGQQVLILVPEIGLTLQFIDRIEKILAIPFVVVHSEVNETQKMQAWEAAKHHVVSLVIGTRSALFTPFDNLGLIIVDEEHDASYRQRDTVRYSAHDAAIQRAYLLNIPLMLGSATPTLETVHNVIKQRYQLLPLTERAKGTPPQWHIVDMNDAIVMDGISMQLLDAIETTIARQEQVIIYLNRRGYSPVILCEACGWVPECPDCEYRLTVYRQSRSLRCHHCGHREPLPQCCPACDSGLLKMVGQGTERIEKALSDAFPNASVIRFDRDQLRTKTAFANAVTDVMDGKAGIVIGTQMIAKGHDFDKVTLVGMLDIDGILYSSDFRADEKLAQTLMQVSGRSGRDVSHGQVIIQTHFPEHSLFTELPIQGYAQYARGLLTQRQHFEFPPFAHQALFQVEGLNERETLKTFESLMNTLDCQAYPVAITPIYPNALSKRQNYYRFYVVLQSRSRKALHQLVHYLMQEATKHLPSRIRHFCEIDPWDFD